MGLVDKYKKGNWLYRKIVKLCFKHSDNILFIGKGELKAAKKSIKICSQKYTYIPFSVDLGHWTYNQKKSPQLKEILFIGNDLNRDFELLYSIEKKYTEYNFTIVSNYDKYEFKNLKNIKCIKGTLRENILSDNKTQT